MAGNCTVSIRKLNGQHVGEFALPAQTSVAALKQAIEGAGGPPPSEQQLVAGHAVLRETDLIGEALRAGGNGDSSSGMIFLVTVAGCPTCKGPCACSLCGCKPSFGLIDYYGVCKECGKCGGHASNCIFCLQRFPSLCALDTHIRFAHEAEHAAGNWNNTRLDEHLRHRGKPGSPSAVPAEAGTFMESCTGGLPSSWESK